MFCPRYREPSRDRARIAMSHPRARRLRAKPSDPCQHRRLVGKYVAKGVLGEDDIELPRIHDKLHRAIIDEHVDKLDIGIIDGDTMHDLSPETPRVEHVGLINTRDLATTLRSRIESLPRDTLDLVLVILHDIVRMHPRGSLHGCVLAKVQASRELADDEDIATAHRLGFER